MKVVEIDVSNADLKAIQTVQERLMHDRLDRIEYGLEDLLASYGLRHANCRRCDKRFFPLEIRYVPGAVRRPSYQIMCNSCTRELSGALSLCEPDQSGALSHVQEGGLSVSK